MTPATMADDNDDDDGVDDDEKTMMAMLNDKGSPPLKPCWPKRPQQQCLMESHSTFYLMSV